MNPRYLAALKLFSLPKVTSADIGGGASVTEVSWQDILMSILFKFIDVLEGVGIIILGLLLIKILRRYLEHIQVEHERQRTALNLLEKIISGFIVVISFTLGLKVMGLDLTLIVSVILLGVSFGLRDIIKNYVAGLQILLKSPFEIGDVVKIRTFVGKVEKIEFQSTTLRTFDNKTITIQNRDLLIQSLTNFSKAQQTRIEVTVPVGDDVNFTDVVVSFGAVLDANPAVLKNPRYSVVFKKFAAKTAQIVVRFWVQRPCNELQIKSELALALKGAMRNAKPNANPQENVAGATQLAPAAVPATEYADMDEPG